MGSSQSKTTLKEDFKSQIENFNERLERSLVGSSQAKKTFNIVFDTWLENRQEVADTLLKVADEIDRHHSNVNVANLTGATSSIAGGTSAIVGLILAPFSGGISVALTAGSLFGSIAGTATTLGANVTEVLLTKDLMEKVKQVLQTDNLWTKVLANAFSELIIHENEVIKIIAEFQREVLTDEVEQVLKSHPQYNEVKNKIKHMKNGSSSLENMLTLMSCLYSEDKEFQFQLNKTNVLYKDTPSLSNTLSTSSEFFQALKELSSVGPETVKGISEAVLQTSAVTGAQSASLGAQLISGGLGTVFVALDVHHLIKTKQNYDQGSKTELSEKLRATVAELLKEKSKVKNLCSLYKENPAIL